MSTPILTVAPAGSWNLDPVHSRVDFEVRYLAGTFKGEFHEIGAELRVEGERASLLGTAKGRERGRQGREPLSPSAVARLLRCRAAPGAPLRSPGHPPRRRQQGLRRWGV